jgi:hypothetical protein
MLFATHKRSGKSYLITEVLKYSRHYVKAISGEITIWFGKDAYEFEIVL